MAVACMPMRARMPMEKIRMPSSASISITPACDLAMRMESSAASRVGEVREVDRRIAHANRAPCVDGNTQAAHRFVSGHGLAGAVTGIGDVDLGERSRRRRRLDQTPQAVEPHTAAAGG